MTASGEAAVFIDTSIGTHLAMAVSPHTSVSDFKRELEREHLSCFPDLGRIKVFSLMVKRRNCFYHLADSMPILYSFKGISVETTQFLHAEVKHFNGLDQPCSQRCKTRTKYSSSGNYVAESLVGETEKMLVVCSAPEGEILPTTRCSINKGMKNGKTVKKSSNCKIHRINGEYALCENNLTAKVGNSVRLSKPMNGSSSTMVLNQVDRSSEIASSSEDISHKVNSLHLNISCVPSSPEVVSSDKDTQVGLQLQMQVASIRKSANKTPVGKRILIAANNLKQSGNKQRSAVSLCGFRAAFDVTPVIRSSIFDISDSDD